MTPGGRPLGAPFDGRYAATRQSAAGVVCCVLCVLLPLLTSATCRPVGGSGLPPSPEEPRSDALEQRVHQLVNAHRQSAGLAPLAFDERIAAIARVHSEDMANGRIAFGHDGFDERTRSIRQFLEYRRVAENVGWNDHPSSVTVDVAVDGWLRSEGHRENIEGPYDLTGVGIARGGGKFYFTQIFVKRT